MKVSNKTNLAAGIVLLLLAAFFSIALLLQPLDFGQFGPGHENFLFILGSMLITVYGFTSILIPLFLFAAAISCFATNWTARRSMRLLTAVIPFFTSFAAEKLIKFFLKGENFIPLKITVTVIIAVMLIIIEFLLAGIIADKISSPKTAGSSKDENGASSETAAFVSEENEISNEELYSGKENFVSEKNDNAEEQFDSNEVSDTDSSEDENNLDYEKPMSRLRRWLSTKTAKKSTKEDSDETEDTDTNEQESYALKIEPILSKKSGEDPFAGVFDNTEKTEVSESAESPKNEISENKNSGTIENTEIETESYEEVKHDSKAPVQDEVKTEETDDLEDNSNPASIITREEYAALTGFNDKPEKDELEWPDAEEIKAKAGNTSGDISDFEEDPYALADLNSPSENTKNISDSETEEETTETEPETETSESDDIFSFEDETPAETENAVSKSEYSSDNEDIFSFGEESEENTEAADEEDDIFSDEEKRILNSESDSAEKIDAAESVEDKPDFSEDENDLTGSDNNFSNEESDFSNEESAFSEENEINFPEEEIIEDEDEFYKPENKKRNLSEELFDEEDDEDDDDDEEFPIFGQTEDKKNDETTLESDFEDSFNQYENIVRNEEPSEDDDFDSENNNYFTPRDVIRTQKMEDEEKKSSLSSEIFDDMEADIRKEVKKEMLYKKYGAPQFEDEEDISGDENDENYDSVENESENDFANNPILSDSEENEISIPVVKQNRTSAAMPSASSHRAMPKKPYSVPTDLLQHYDDDQYWIIDEETKLNAQKLMNTLTDFGISAEVISIKKGPVVTMYELEPAPGVRLSKIVSLQDNIALSLAASSVRIVAPIPGRAAVGIEVPNKKRSIVSFREMIEQDLPDFKKMAVPVVLGKDILGKSQIIDIAKTPHLLIAGATGAGKSVCVNSIILSILYKRSPQQVKMILVDPKVVELKLYNDIPHLLTPVITEPKKALQALHWCLCEMERRYALLDQMGVRDISSYNTRVEERNICTEKLPYIVIIIDEFADLMATSGKELESNVARLAAMSRAVGIHLVLATQRPSVNVITGLIKANIPSRIAFMVASRTDSNIIIDSVGAEKLLGKGDMLYASAVDPYPVRIQGTFESDNDVENVVDYVKTLGEPDYIDDEMFIEEEEEDSTPSMFNEGSDPLYEQALDIVIQAGKASASYIQRRLKIGYNRAARLVEEMEERGIVGPANGSKPREVIHMP